MKRLILRIAALGTVVILGLFAIAQAQRGAEDSPPPAGESALADQGSSDQGAAGQIISPAGSGSPLRRGAPAGPASNPLRSQNVPTEEIPPARVPIGDYRTTPAVADAVPAEPPLRTAAVDPFGLQASRSRTATGPATEQIVRTSHEIPDAPPPTAPQLIAAEATRYPQLVSPSAGVQPLPGGPPIAGSAEPPADRYPVFEREASEGREPKLLEADSPTSPAGISRLGTAADGFALPGAEAASPQAPLTGEGIGQPGGEQLEGPQSPQLTIQKSAPEEIQVGKAATFRVTVRNTGSVVADGVEIRDRIPKGTRLMGTTPRASTGPRGELVWAVGSIQPGDESSVEVQLMPVSEGEIGSVATVCFSADASARTIATKPELVLEASAPGQVLIGEEITLTITVSNPGSGVATGVVLEEQIPSGLQHPTGGDLEYEVGDLPPGESRRLELTMVASRPGPLTNLLTARGDGSLKAESRLDLEVISPQLEVALAGPRRRYLEREATYRLSVHNPGTAAAQQVELVAYLPSGLKFLSANNSGHYEEQNRTVHWRLEELPVGDAGTVELVAMPVEEGQQSIRLRGTAEKGLTAEAEQPVLIEGIAAIMFEAVDVIDPIEVGGQTTYEIRVLNQGSKAAENVQLAVLLPTEMRAASAEGPTGHAVDGNRVLFEGLSRLAPKADTTYRVSAQGLQPGDLRVHVQLLTDEMRAPVTKEVSTRVYSDE